MDERQFTRVIGYFSVMALILLGYVRWYHTPPATDTPLKAGQEVVTVSREEAQQPCISTLPAPLQGGAGELLGQPVYDTYETSVARIVIDRATASIAQMTLSARQDGRLVTPLDMYTRTQEQGGYALPLMVMFQEGIPVGYELAEQRRDEATGRWDIVYRYTGPLVSVEKIFSIPRDSYEIDVKIRVFGQKTTVTPLLLLARPGSDAKNTRVVYRDETGSLVKTDFASSCHKARIQPELWGIASKYMLTAVLPGAGTSPFMRGYVSIVDKQEVAFLQGWTITPDQTAPVEWQVRCYMGPLELQALEQADAQLGSLLEYGFLGILVKALMQVLLLLYSVIHNYGIAIMVLTILLNLVLLPISRRGEKTMERMQDMQRRLQYIEQKYKHDAHKLAAARADLIAEHKGGLDPLGCVTMGIQVLFFISLNRLLSSYIGLHQAPFVGWMHDLSSSDPYYIIPVVLTLGIGIRSLVYVKEPRQQFMAVGIALIVGAVTAHFSIGLLLFLSTNMLFRVVAARIW